MKTKHTLLLLLASTLSLSIGAQSEIYPQHFNLNEVTLLDSPFKRAMTVNNTLLLQYDADRLLTPFIRQAGLDTASGNYKNWSVLHPSFTNWGESSWSLEGHVGGHYLTALSLAVAATDDAATRSALKERLDYCLNILNDCQKAYDTNTQGLYGFLGGQPINQIWTGLYSGDTAPYRKYGGWVPLYCEHKVLAGLRDAWLYTGSEQAKEMFRKVCDWSVNLIANLTDAQLQDILGWEHGGMNETLADAYRIFGDAKYLNAAKRYSHTQMVDGMQTLNTSFLDGKHANTQVPKYVGFERIYQEELRSGNASTDDVYRTAAHNFWQDVADNRTVCIGGNSIGEHFLARANAERYISNTEGPESCNSNNMLKLSEDLFDETHDARYADFYEYTTWNHILSTQDPETGGYVYFTSLRPQSYRIYSVVNKGMWCCVGTGMENHSKYGHFIYTHSEDNKTLYVNLFTASTLQNETFALRQETQFPYEQKTKITIDKGGSYTLAIRHPHWTSEGYVISVNGSNVAADVTQGVADYVNISRTWKAGDVVEVQLPMSLNYVECPGLSDYIAFTYGPVLLAAQTTATSPEEAAENGLNYENLQNEYAGEERMGHSPAVMGTSLSISSSPLLIGERSEVLSRISPTEESLNFKIDARSTQSKGDWTDLTLVPFYTLHHARYSCYWYQATPERYAASDMGLSDARDAALAARTIDYVATGEQQSEAGHQYVGSSDSGSGIYQGEYYRDAQSGGYVQYVLENNAEKRDSVSLLVRYTTADKNRVCSIYINNVLLTDVQVASSAKNADDKGFYEVEYPIPASLLTGNEVTVRFVASGSTPLPGLYYIRLMSGYDAHTYTFVATDWVTGDVGRVSQDNISYDTTANTITLNSGTGLNDVCLQLQTDNREYYVPLANKYLVVKGRNISLLQGKSYLWWLNGKNKGTSVAPTRVATAQDGEKVIAWDITESDLNANCTADPWDACQGMTIFGLTSTTGKAIISYIGFESSIEDFLASVGIEKTQASQKVVSGVYNLQGMRMNTDQPLHGIYVVNGKKVQL
jgi:hypothetical protein